MIATTEILPQNPPSPTGTEQPAYIDHGGFQIYSVSHHVQNPKGLVLLCGPFATERPYSYVPWVRWARYLARNGFASLRFDYRGVGESSGNFSDASFAAWTDDTLFCANRLAAKYPGVPLTLHGLGLGGVIASNAFKSGVGQALLLWSSPESGDEALREGLMRRLAVDFANPDPSKRKKWEDYMEDLNKGGNIPVQGYPITGPLWNEAGKFKLYVPGQKDAAEDKRPVRRVKLDKSAAPLIAGIGQWRALNPAIRVGFVPMNPDLTTLYKENLDWMQQAINSGGAQ